MADLETQVVKIQLGDTKQATSYVYTLAETVDSSQAELYMICELPLFNPAAADECERIAQAIAASLRRSYRRPPTANTFENSLTVINEELGKLQNLGKTHWLGKLNSVIAVKSGTRLSVTSVGKITALLYRDGNFAPVAESSTPHHPLKTFENFSEGKIRLDDLIVLSTSQLFNHISIDRFKNILKRNDLPDAAQEVIATLQDAMGPEGACGTILAKQVEAGTLEEVPENDLGAYMAAPSISSRSQGADWLDRIKAMGSTAAVIGKNAGSSLKSKIKTARPANLKDLVKRQDGALQVVQSQFKKVGKNFQPETIKGYSKQKKIFMIAAAILLVAVIGNVAIAKYFSNKPKTVEISADKITAMEKSLSDANSALLYGDEAQAKRLLSDLQNQINGLGSYPDSQKDKIQNIKDQANALDQKLNHVGDAKVETLGTLSDSDNLIVLPTYFATESNGTITSYNRSTKEVKNDALHKGDFIAMSGYYKGDQAVTFNGRMELWNFKTGDSTGSFSDGLPNADNAAGLTVYNGKVYIVDRNAKKVMKFTVGDNSFSSPTPSVQADEIANASDMAIDSNIYIAANGTILKYTSGAKQDFNPGVSNLPTNTKLYTENGFTNLYVLDPAGKKIIIMDKTGKVSQTLTSGQFTDLKDFYVDEKGKAAYVLNGNQLLKASF